MKNQKLKPEDFPLYGIINVIDTANTEFSMDDTHKRGVLKYVKLSVEYPKGYKKPKYDKTHMIGVLDDIPASQMATLRMKQCSTTVLLQDKQILFKSDIEERERVSALTGLDADDLLESAGISEHLQAITRDALRILFESSERTRTQKLGVLENMIRLVFPKYVRKTKVETQMQLVRTVLKECNRIFGKCNEYGMADYIITNGKLACIMQDSSGFAYSQENPASNGTPMIYQCGTVYGKKLLVDPNMKWDDDRILIGVSAKPGRDGLYTVFDSSSLKTELECDLVRTKIEVQTELIGRDGLYDMPECSVLHLQLPKNIF